MMLTLGRRLRLRRGRAGLRSGAEAEAAAQVVAQAEVARKMGPSIIHWLNSCAEVCVCVLAVGGGGGCPV